MKRTLITVIAAALLFLSLSSCRLIANLGGIISIIAETETEAEPFDRSEAYGLIPDLDKKYRLSALSDVHLQNACRMYRAVAGFEEYCAVTGNIPRDDAIALFRLLELECPELFQLDGSSSLRIEYTTGGNVAKRIFFDYRMTKDEYEDAVKRVDEVVEDYLARVRKLSDYEKEVKAFEYIARRCKYDDNAGFSDSAYGSLVLGSAKCDGISRGFQTLCEAAGLTCILVMGESKTGGTGHAWNMVKLGDGFYNVDLTQSVRAEDDPEDGDVIYYFFNVADKWMIENYEIYDYVGALGTLPVCDTFEQSYYAQLGCFVREGGDCGIIFADGMDNALKKNKPFYMQFESANEAAQFSESLQLRVALWAGEHSGVSSVQISTYGDRLYMFKIKRGGN